jgi:hypothetical protein
MMRCENHFLSISNLIFLSPLFIFYCLASNTYKLSPPCFSLFFTIVSFYVTLTWFEVLVCGSVALGELRALLTYPYSVLTDIYCLI